MSIGALCDIQHITYCYEYWYIISFRYDYIHVRARLWETIISNWHFITVM